MGQMILSNMFHIVWKKHGVCFVAENVKRKSLDVQSFFQSAFHQSYIQEKIITPLVHPGFAPGKHVTSEPYQWCSVILLSITTRVLCTTTGQGPFCPHADNKHHRVFECTGLASIRKKYVTTLKWASKEPDACFAFGTTSISEDVLLGQKLSKPGNWSTFPAKGPMQYLFIDGASFFNQSWGILLLLFCGSGSYQCPVWNSGMETILPCLVASRTISPLEQNPLHCSLHWSMHIVSMYFSTVKQW